MDIIQSIAKTLSDEFSEILNDGKLRISSAQKSFNVYLKYLWLLNINCDAPLAPPLHCPIDRNILQAVNIQGNWTECDSIDLYASWINTIRNVASKQNLGFSQKQFPDYLS